MSSPAFQTAFFGRNPSSKIQKSYSGFVQLGGLLSAWLLKPNWRSEAAPPTLEDPDPGSRILHHGLPMLQVWIMDNGSLILDAAHINIARISVLKLSIFENKSDLALHQQLMDVSVGVQE